MVPVIDHAVTSTFLDPKDMEKAFQGELEGCYLYSRHRNPTVMAFCEKLAAMESTESALGVSSGMAAISCTLQQLNLGGGHVVSSSTVYGGTYALFKNIFPKQGIDVTFVPHNDVEAFEKAITKNTKVLYAETMSNPLLAVTDIPRLSKMAKKHNITLVIDNTFSPAVVTPHKLGADVVVYSCTKYISGASDMTCGAICGSKDFIDKLIDIQTGMVMLCGPTMSSSEAYLLYARLDHLPLRMKAHCEQAEFFARKVKEHTELDVIYPGLKEHPQHEIFNSFKNPGYGYGGMVTVDCKSLQKAIALSCRLQEEKFGLFAVSLGFSRTLMSCPSVSTSSEISQSVQEEMNLKEGLLRLSIGVLGHKEEMWERFLKCYKLCFS